MDNRDILLSVVIPIYRVEDYLERCLDSTLAAAIEDMEIILVDDGSDDACPAICDRYAAANKNIRVIHQKNAGISAARNNGIALTQGEYIFFLDSDDAVDPEIFRQFRDYVRSRDVRPDMLLTDCVFVHSVTGEETPFLFPVGAEELHDVTGQQALKKMLQARPNFEWYCWRYFYRRAYLIENELDFPVGATFEDVLFTSKALIMAQLIDYMPAVGLRYTNFRKGSIVNSMYLKKVQDKLFISRSACAFDVAHVKDPELLAMLLSNHAEYYIGAFRNYCECVPEAYPYLKECVYLAKYSKTRFGKMVYLATKFLGFRLGSLVAKQLFRILGLDK